MKGNSIWVQIGADHSLYYTLSRDLMQWVFGHSCQKTNAAGAPAGSRRYARRLIGSLEVHGGSPRGRSRAPQCY
jgi:hypothetical protein